MAEKAQALDEYFINIEEPLSLRRSILEASRESIRVLQDYERLEVVREEKKKAIMEYDEAMKEIITLMARLKDILPKVQAKKAKVVPKKVEKETETVKVAEVKTKSELEKLEDELREVEKQLGTL